MSHVEEVSDDAVIEISWPELSLAIAIMTFTILLWPMYGYIVTDVILVPFRLCFGLIDIRQWTWRSYAVANVMAVIALVLVRLRQSQE